MANTAMLTGLAGSPRFDEQVPQIMQRIFTPNGAMLRSLDKGRTQAMQTALEKLKRGFPSSGSSKTKVESPRLGTAGSPLASNLTIWRNSGRHFL
jgi:hypothetical protein